MLKISGTVFITVPQSTFTILWKIWTIYRVKSAPISLKADHATSHERVPKQILNQLPIMLYWDFHIIHHTGMFKVLLLIITTILLIIQNKLERACAHIHIQSALELLAPLMRDDWNNTSNIFLNKLCHI